MSAKLVGAWVLGSILLLLGSWILSNLEKTIGVSDFSYLFALLISLGCFLLAGICWIAVAAATKHV